MDVIKAVRELGKAIQQDERFIRYAKARLENDNNEELQAAINKAKETSFNNRCLIEEFVEGDKPGEAYCDKEEKQILE